MKFFRKSIGPTLTDGRSKTIGAGTEMKTKGALVLSALENRLRAGLVKRTMQTDLAVEQNSLFLSLYVCVEVGVPMRRLTRETIRHS